MPISNYPNGFANGVSVQGFPFIIQQNGLGKTFWVDSVNGSDGNKGNQTYPLATIAKAISLSTASKGDIIMVAAGHAETIVDATSLDINKIGVQIIGMGTGNFRPTITFATATAASVVISAADVMIHNIRGVCNIASQVTMFDVNAARVVINNCSFEEGTATGITMVDVNGGSANACDGVQILNSEFSAPTAGNYNGAIELGEVADGVVIDNCTVWGDFDDAAIHNPTGKILTNLKITNCTLTNLLAGQHAIELVSACTGIAANNYMFADTYATTIDPGALICFECYSNASADKNGRLNPVVES